MEYFVLFCCRSCLKGEDDNKQLYEILKVEDRRAHVDVIKKAFKKQSLSLHPDKLAQRGIAVTPEHSQQFLKIKEAYDILSDPKRRRLYDKIGYNGLKMLENPSQVDPTTFIRNFQNNKKDMLVIAFVVALIFCFILYLPVMFCLKCDGTIGDNFPWVAVWIPVWLLDAVLIIAAILIFTENTEEEDDGGDDTDEERRPKLHIPFTTKLFNLLETVLIVLIQVFVILRLDDFTEWSWFTVFTPWFAYEVLNIVTCIPSAVKFVEPPDHDSVHEALEDGDDVDMQHFMIESAYFDTIMSQASDRKSIIEAFYRVIFSVFLALKLDDSVDWNWGVVLLPVWCYICTEFLISHMYNVWGKERTEGLDLKVLSEQGAVDPVTASKIKQGESMQSSSSAICCSQLIPLFIAVLLVSRLQSGVDFSTFFILLPIFLILGCCCCGVFCGIGCLANVDADKMADEIKKQQGGWDDEEAGTAFVSPSETKAYSPPAPSVIVTTESPFATAGSAAASGSSYGSIDAQSQSQHSVSGISSNSFSGVVAKDIDID